MFVPPGYKGELLFDDRVPPVPIKLNYEKKSISKEVLRMVSNNKINLKGAAETEIKRLIGVIITLLNIESNNSKSVYLVYKFFRTFQLSQEGRLISTKGEFRNRKENREIKLVGMDNYNKTTCYLDALLISMFYSNSAFDFLLDKSVDPHLSNDLQVQVERLKTILRFLVNLIRSGEMININIMYQLLLVLNSMGCEMALSNKQQDSLQIFEFLAESLSLPLLTLKLDILHSGKLNINDDLRLIGERALLISVPLGSQSVDLPIKLEECLNSFFNNSITVRRHLENQKVNYPLPPSNIGSSTMIPKSRILSNSNDILLDSFEENQSEINEYEKMGILKSQDSSINPISSLKILHANSISTESADIPSLDSSVLVNDITPIHSRPTSPLNKTPSLSAIRSSTSLNSGAVIEFSPSNNSDPNFTPKNMSSTDTESNMKSGSFKNVNEKLERQRTRSSTLVTVLNNVQINNPTARLTRRSSSISNTEVSLPAWMYLQLLPYYTDPEIKLTFENHEEYYRRRTSRSKTIDSIQNTPATNNETVNEQSPNSEEQSTYFSQRFGNKRPVIPICLKRYTWNERGQSIKLDRKILIPEFIKYPYFIAEDKKKPGFVDFSRSINHIAPRGSFVLVLQSCVCHRGNSINSGHYVSIARKRAFDISKFNEHTVSYEDEEWIVFNDLEVGESKCKIYLFDEIMELEEPYILFYELHELKDNNSSRGTDEVDEDINLDIPVGGKASYWNRKPSALSGLSVYSEQTLLQEEESINDDISKSNHSNTSSIKNKHLNLAGLNLNRSKSKSINDIDDIIDEYYWYDSTYDYKLSETAFKYSTKPIFKHSYNSNTTSSNNSLLIPNTENSNDNMKITTETNMNSYMDDDINEPFISVMEISDSNPTPISLSTNDKNKSNKGEVEFLSSPAIVLSPVRESNDFYSTESSKMINSTELRSKESVVEKVEDDRKEKKGKKKGKIKNLLKKVFR